jgi:CheY-like chemotaxis protein
MRIKLVSGDLSILNCADILLVDDNAIQAATRKAILTHAGRRVLVAENGEQALNLLGEQQGCPSVRLVLTDHLMPGMNGPEFVRRLRERYPEVPVLVLSGLAEAEDAYEGLEVMFRLKPLPPRELLEVVRGLLKEPMERSA